MRRLRYLIVLTVVAVVTGLLQGFPAVAAAHGKARSDFGVRVKSDRTPLPVRNAKTPRLDLAKERAREFRHAASLDLGGRRQRAGARSKVAAVPPPANLRLWDWGMPGSVSWAVKWDSDPNQGCEFELYRTSDNKLMWNAASEQLIDCQQLAFDNINYAFPEKLVAGQNYYIKVRLYHGTATTGEWGTWATSASWAATSTPGISLLQELGLCSCNSSLGWLATLLKFFGDPVNTATGNFTESATDVKMAAPGIAFDLTRTYNSADTSVGLLGRGWVFPYGASLAVASDRVTYRSEDGAQAIYSKKADGTFTPPPGTTSKLAKTTGGYTLTTRDYQVLSFDTAGKLTSWVDRAGQGLSFGYTSGVLSSITDAAGRQVAVTVVSGKVTKVTLPDGRHVSYGYTGDFLSSFTDLRGHVTSYEPDPTGKLLGKIKDPKGRYVTSLTYDSSGRVTQLVDGTGYTVTYAYDARGAGWNTVTDLRGTRVYHYAANVLISEADPLGNTTYYDYDTKLRPIAVTDPRGNTTTTGYDTAGHVTSKVGPAPSHASEAWTYLPGTDDLDTHTDQLGTVTSYTYNGQHLPTGVTQTTVGGASRSQSYTYTARGLVETHTSYAGRVTTNGYDTQGNLTSVTSGEGNKTGYGYDATGRRTSVTDPRGTASAEAGDYTTTYGYDDADHVTSQTNARGKTTTSTFDEVGDLTKVTDPDGFSTVYTYDAAHRQLTMQRDGWSSPESRTYYADGLLAVVSDPTGATTKYGYDAAGRLQSKVTPRGNVSGADKTKYQWIYTADPNGNQTSVKDPDTGKTATTTFDELNRPTVVTDSLGHATTTGV